MNPEDNNRPRISNRLEHRENWDNKKLVWSKHRSESIQGFDRGEKRVDTGFIKTAITVLYKKNWKRKLKSVIKRLTTIDWKNQES